MTDPSRPPTSTNSRRSRPDLLLVEVVTSPAVLIWRTRSAVVPVGLLAVPVVEVVKVVLVNVHAHGATPMVQRPWCNAYT